MDQVQINPKRLDAFTCVCGGSLFDRVYILKFVPGIMVGATVHGLIAIESHRCIHCLKIVEEDDIQGFGKKKGMPMMSLFLSLTLVCFMILSGCTGSRFAVAQKELSKRANNPAYPRTHVIRAYQR